VKAVILHFKRGELEHIAIVPANNYNVDDWSLPGFRLYQTSGEFELGHDISSGTFQAATELYCEGSCYDPNE